MLNISHLPSSFGWYDRLNGNTKDVLDILQCDAPDLISSRDDVSKTRAGKDLPNVPSMYILYNRPAT